MRFSFVLSFFLCGASFAQTIPEESTPYTGTLNGAPADNVPVAAPRAAPRGRFREREGEGLTQRERTPGFIGVNFGEPSPAIIGATIGFQLNNTLQIIASAGRVWLDSFQANMVSASARFYILPYQFSPFVGGGATAYFITASGDYAGLNTSTIMPLLSLGLDWISDFGLRMDVGINFMFPVSFMFGFAQIGLSF